MKNDFLSNAKGMFDASPQAKMTQNFVLDTLRRNFEGFGYMPLETAMVNYLPLLTYKYDADAEIVREIYKIRDQGDRDLGLRFDLTVPFCKYIATNPNMKMPFKRYEIGKVWRNGPVKNGRAREFYQCDIDAVGISTPCIEAEMMAMAVKCYLELGVTPVIRYGNRKLLPYSDAVIAIIDRMAKVSREELVADLCKHMEKPAAEKLLNDVKNATKIPEVVELETYLTELGINKYCEFTPNLARGLNVYTGTVWEVFAKDSNMTSSLGGGGRYDKIIGNFIDNGKEYPAVGMSFGLEPIMAVLNERSDKPARTGLVDLMIIPLGTESAAQKYADGLRKQGKRVLVYLGNKNLAKAFEYAASYGITQAMVFGPDEATGKEPVIKIVN
ncbi:MAG: ATP phosphoribosyltransferase regulatory subunit [Christensenellaceae bacterium]|nr:ATP phosphoribosyltransferase regulatory subunit [Christensenellaceae bacterium]